LAAELLNSIVAFVSAGSNCQFVELLASPQSFDLPAQHRLAQKRL
jgi:hypothetical protein